MSYQDALRHRLLSRPLQEAPPPWRRAPTYAVGGLTEIGFAEGTDLLLVISSGGGRGVFDGRTGEKVARDSAEPDDAWYDPVRLTAQGIGPLDGQRVRLAGLHGGGLPVVTDDGWCVEMVFPAWPDGMVVLTPPGSREAGLRIVNVDVPRAFGFSPTGRTLVVAESHSLHLFCRD